MKFTHWLASLALIVAVERFIPSATAGVLSDAYRGFLQDGNSNVFFSFEREQIIPTRLSGAHEDKAADGRLIKIVYPINTEEYCAIRRCGPYFLAAYSGKAPFLKLSDFANAEALEGCDGAYYWRVTLFSGPPSSNTFYLNPLILIPMSEAARAQGMYSVDTELRFIQLMKQKFTLAVQFGYPLDLAKPPQLRKGTLSIEGEDGVTQIAKLVGSDGKPDEIDYSTRSNLNAVAAFDYNTDTLTITRRGYLKNRVVSQEKIHAIAFEQSSTPPATGLFAWQTYKAVGRHLEAGGTHLVAQLITNGTSVEVNFESPSSTNFHLGEVIEKAQPPPLPPVFGAARITSSKVVIIRCFFLLVTAGAGYLIWLHEKSTTSRK